MPVGEIAGELLGGVFKFIGRLFFEVFIEFFIRGAGYLICRLFRRDVDPDGIWVTFVGLLIWLLIGFGGFELYQFIELQDSIESFNG